jgi:DNA-binding transcriptional LysR family regulator
MVGNFDYLEIHTPLRHLRSGVIDAWIGCYPDVPEPEDPEFACFHLTRLPASLVVRADHPLLALGAAISLEDVKRYPSLALADGAFPRVQARLQELGLWNLPQQGSRCTRQRWERLVDADLVVGYASAFTLHLFEAPQVILPVPLGLEVGDSLVVRREYADHSRLLAVLEHLRQRAAELARRYSEVRIPSTDLG